ncbi:MAG: hypothetical protein ACJA0H_001927 [Francisellaceae bacterium]|jgi:hypothetical protein
MISLKELSVAFAAGALGAIVITILLWLEIKYGITSALSIKISSMSNSELTVRIYKMIAWGGLWAFLLLIPYAKSRWFIRGIVFSLIPTVVTFLYFAPQSGLGYFGVNAGYLMPINILVLNIIWGIVAAWWFNLFASK